MRNTIHTGRARFSPVLATLLIESSAPGCNKLTREVQLVRGFDHVEMTNILDKQRAELNLMRADVDSAQKAFDTVTASAAQARLQAMSNQTNVMKLASAVEPSDPTGPSPMVAVVVALIRAL